MVEAIGKALRAELRDLNRYPDRDAVALRTDLAGYLGHGLTTASVWAANGSNEVQQQLLQAFGGPGRTALGFGPSYSMHPLLAAGTGTGWVGALRGRRLRADRRRRRSPRSREHRPDVVFLCSPNNPTGTALDPAVVDRGAGRRARHGDRRRGVRRVRPPGHARARWRCWPGTRGWSSPGR